MIYDKKFLIITAHPDDLEMGCAGLVSKIKAHGGMVTNLILVKPSAEDNIKRSKSIVEKELNASSTLLEMDVQIYDTPLHNNGRPNLVLNNNLISYAEKIAKDHDILISHWREDHHQDHRVRPHQSLHHHWLDQTIRYYSHHTYHCHYLSIQWGH